MLTKLIIIFATGICAVVANNEESSFHMKFEKCEVGSYNKDWIKDLEMKCINLNETHFKVDGSGNLLKEMNFDKVLATGQVYVYDGDKYVMKPNLKMTIKACEEYTAENFGYWKEIENHGNVKGCGMHKPGVYSVKDYIPRMKIKDVSVPKEARIKLSVKMNYEDKEMLEIHFFLGVAPK